MKIEQGIGVQPTNTRWTPNREEDCDLDVRIQQAVVNAAKDGANGITNPCTSATCSANGTCNTCTCSCGC